MTFADKLWSLATDPNMTPEKLAIAAKAVADAEKREAERQFHKAFLKLQKSLPEVGKHGELIRDGQVVCNFSRFEDIQRAIAKPLQDNGFTLSRHNVFPRERTIEVVAVLTHVGGHHTENPFQLASDDSLLDGNDNQKMASAQSYAARYATAGLLNLILAETDDDGERSATVTREATNTRPKPAEYDKRLKFLEAAAAKGGAAHFQKAYKSVEMDIKMWAVEHEPARLEALKRQAVTPKVSDAAPF